LIVATQPIGQTARQTELSANRRILIAALVVAACTVVAKLAGAGKDLVLAAVYGVSASLDTFLLAYLFPSVCVNILAGSLQAAFIPKYVSARSSEGEAAAAKFTASTASLLFLALTAMMLVAAPIVGLVMPVLAGQLPPEHIADAQWMATALMPIVVLNGLMYFWSGYLNTFNRFAVPALTPIVTPVCIATAAVVFASEHGVSVLIFGALIGGAIELAIVLLGARTLTPGRLFASPQFTARHRAMFTQFGAAAAGNLLMGATLIVDQSFAASLGAGAVSTLSFGTKLSQVTAGIFTMAIATAVLPNAARLAAERDWPGIRRTLRSYTIIVFGVTLPITGALMYFSEDIIRLLFERGAFDRADTSSVAFVQLMSALQIPFFAWSMLIVRVLSAISANAVLLLGAVISLILDIVLNFSLVPILGVAGVGLATSIMYACACVFLSVSLHRRLQRLERAGP
jgi:putative peptidoglycan lipid II flippase